MIDPNFREEFHPIISHFKLLSLVMLQISKILNSFLLKSIFMNFLKSLL